MTKYKEYVDLMLTNHKDLFDEFKQIHDRYGLEGDKLQVEFNELGKKVLAVIRQWEDKLCGRSEGSGYASYSGGLAQKFQDEIRKIFPMIDNVGIIVESSAPVFAEATTGKPADDFIIKKINL